MLKLPLGAREEVNEGSRPFDRKAVLGDSGGLKTPFEPLSWVEPESLGDNILEEGFVAGDARILIVSCGGRGVKPMLASRGSEVWLSEGWRCSRGGSCSAAFELVDIVGLVGTNN